MSAEVLIIGGVLIAAKAASALAKRNQDRAPQQAMEAHQDGARVIAEVWSMRLVADPPRLVTPSGVFPITADVKASVESSGNITTTRGRNLAAKAAGTALLGPAGALGAGNAKVTAHDLREVYVLVEGRNFAEFVELGGAWEAQARQFVQQVNLAARQAPATATANAGGSAASTTRASVSWRRS